MKKDIKNLLRFSQQFGVKYGLKLFFKFKFGDINSIKIPLIKHNITLRKETSDIPTFFQVFVHNEYGINYSKYIGSPKVVIDGGANIGLFTILMKNKFPEAKVICIEPDKENFELLKKNVESYDNVFCLNNGLWNKSIKLKVFDKYKRGKWGIVVEENEREGEIQAVSIGDLLNKFSIEEIDILKLDIETSEKKVFQNNFESWLPKTKMLIIELHDYMDENCSKTFFEAINKTFTKYEYHTSGENTIIINKGI